MSLEEKRRLYTEFPNPVLQPVLLRAVLLFFFLLLLILFLLLLFFFFFFYPLKILIAQAVPSTCHAV